MKCTNCNGIGLVDKAQEGVVYAQEVCPTCQGVGQIAAPEGAEPVEAPKKSKKK